MTGSVGHAADRFGAFVAMAADPPAGPGPLSALRIAVKDNIAVAGLPFTAGHPLFADRIADTDAAAVRRLREAGARIVGVTRTDAGGFGVTTPEVANPAAPNLTVGGSSGGSGAAVAAGLADVALGTDTGGSVRIPAACTGLIGFKPTRGRIATDGVWPLSPSLDHVGVIGRDLDVVARTAEALLAPGPATPPPSQGSWRVGFDRTMLAACDKTMATAFAQVVGALQGSGMAVVPIALPDLEDVLDAHRTILLAEAREVYRPLSSAQRERLAVVAQRSLKLADDIDDDMVRAARREAARVATATEALFEHADLILSPTISCPVPPRDARRVEINGRAISVVQALIAMTAPFNLSGHPTLALPCVARLHGLPFSIQMTAPNGADRSLFDAAHTLAPLLRLSASTRG
jgi:Asp-tRNA(Asn)/Glu-tRNA(Gln) amidotransferase A subunit family amidase